MSLSRELWKQFDVIRVNSNLKLNECCMPVLGIIFLKHIYLRFKTAETTNSNRFRDGFSLTIDDHDFLRMGAIKLPEQAQFEWILSKYYWNNNIGDILNNAMSLIEEKLQRLVGMLFKQYDKLPNVFLKNVLEIFSNQEIDDKIDEVYELFLEKFSLDLHREEDIAFTPKSLAKMIVNLLEPEKGIVLDPCFGNGGMFVEIKDYMNTKNLDFRKLMYFHGHEKSPCNAKLCLMNVIANGILDVKIACDNRANTYDYDPYNLTGKCDYVLSYSPPIVNNLNESRILNINPWIFYSYLNEKGKAGFAIPMHALEGNDNQFRYKIVETKHVDLLVSVAPNFYTNDFGGSCSLLFFNKQKRPEHENKILFINTSEYFTSLDDGRNIWNDWQIKNLNAIVWLYRGQDEQYRSLLKEYRDTLKKLAIKSKTDVENDNYLKAFEDRKEELNVEINRTSFPYLFDEAKKTLDRGVLIAKEYHWLHSKFGEGGYKDILGFCKAVDLREVREKDYSLIPNSYVDVTKRQGEGNEVLQRLENMHRELAELDKESRELMERIQKNMELWKK